MSKRKEVIRVYRCRRGINHSEVACGALSGRADHIEDIVEKFAVGRLADPKVQDAIKQLRAVPRVVVSEINDVDGRIQELERQLDSPGVPVDAILRAIDRAKERRGLLLGRIASSVPREIPTEISRWPEDVARRRGLIELVIERVTLEAATRPGVWQPERVRIHPRLVDTPETAR